MTEALRVHLVRKILAPRQTVFEAWLDPKRLAQVLKPAPGVTVADLQVDPRVGGSFQLTMVIGETRVPHHGEYLEIDRYHRLVFSWLSPHTLPSSVVTLTFEETGPRSTKVTLEQTGFPHQESCDAHESGWTNILEALERVLGA